MLTLAQYLSSEGLTNAEFARRLSARLKKRVSDQNISRWTLEPGDDEYSIPDPVNLIGIYFETRTLVPIEVWYRHLVKKASVRKRSQPREKRGLASRRGAHQ